MIADRNCNGSARCIKCDRTPDGFICKGHCPADRHYLYSEYVLKTDKRMKCRGKEKMKKWDLTWKTRNSSFTDSDGEREKSVVICINRDGMQYARHIWLQNTDRRCGIRAADKPFNNAQLASARNDVILINRWVNLYLTRYIAELRAITIYAKCFI